MGTLSLEDFVNDNWNDILSLVKNAAVYIDHEASECLHWFTGDKAYLTLKNAGAISVHELAMYNFRYIRVEGTKKAVIISTSSDPAFYQRTVKMIMEKNTFESCILVIAADPMIINYTVSLTTEERADYAKMKRDVKSWTQTKNVLQECYVDIIHKPIFMSLIHDDIFVTPPFGNLMPPLDGDISKDLSADAEYLASSLDSLFAYLRVKEDIFSVGRLSGIVAEKLENLPSALSRRNNQLQQDRGVSLILVDRVLDLCTASSNNAESLLGKILTTLPHLQHHFNDVSVNMAPLLTDSQDTTSQLEINGCLASNNKRMMDMLISKKQKEVLAMMYQLLVNITSRGSPLSKLSTRISAHSLEKFIHKIRDSENTDAIIESSKDLQVTLAIIQALKSARTSQVELLVSLEKLLLQNLAVSRDSSSILSQISNIIKTRSTRGLDTENLLALLMHIYSLAGSEIRFSQQQESQLESAIAEAVCEDILSMNKKMGNAGMTVYQQTLLLLGAADETAAKESSIKMARKLMDTLHLIADQRSSLHNYTCLMTNGSPQEMVQCVGVLEQLVDDIFHPDKPDMPDLCQKTTSLISAGFNLFLKGRAKRHPLDNNWVIIHVIGGVTPEECRKLREIISTKSTNCKLTVSGSRLLSPSDIVNSILLSSVDG